MCSTIVLQPQPRLTKLVKGANLADGLHEGFGDLLRGQRSWHSGLAVVVHGSNLGVLAGHGLTSFDHFFQMRPVKE